MSHPPLPANVPVFDCRVILSPRDDNGVISARVASLPEVFCQGENEREVLRKVVTDFKAAVQRYLAVGGIPWQDPPLEPGPQDQIRFIPVHL